MPRPQRQVNPELDSAEPKGEGRKSRRNETRAIRNFLRRAQTANIVSLEDIEELEDELDSEHEV